mmetsp:Transcript_10884/g.16581  ORF Transcript_10884/g.16581 Transcript_10884/m.16581 type:complete len:200 (+) Transcript_10884:99-698(+)
MIIHITTLLVSVFLSASVGSDIYISVHSEEKCDDSNLAFAETQDNNTCFTKSLDGNTLSMKVVCNGANASDSWNAKIWYSNNCMGLMLFDSSSSGPCPCVVDYYAGYTVGMIVNCAGVETTCDYQTQSDGKSGKNNGNALTYMIVGVVVGVVLFVVLAIALYFSCKSTGKSTGPTVKKIVDPACQLSSNTAPHKFSTDA